MKTEPRLKFTKEEQTAPELKKPIRKVKKAQAKADKAQAKIPKKAVKIRTVDPSTGKVKTKLTFEDKKPPSKLNHAVKAAPINTVSVTAHRKIRQYEDDNLGLEAAHAVEGSTEAGARMTASAVRSQRLRPYRKAAAAERKLERANQQSHLQMAAAAGHQAAVCGGKGWTLCGNHQTGGGGHRHRRKRCGGTDETRFGVCSAPQTGLRYYSCRAGDPGLPAQCTFLLLRHS